MVVANVPSRGFPAASRAGAKLARFLSKRQVAESSRLEPLDAVTVQPVTLPLG